MYGPPCMTVEYGGPNDAFAFCSTLDRLGPHQNKAILPDSFFCLDVEFDRGRAGERSGRDCALRQDRFPRGDGLRIRRRLCSA